MYCTLHHIGTLLACLKRGLVHIYPPPVVHRLYFKESTSASALSPSLQQPRLDLISTRPGLSIRKGPQYSHLHPADHTSPQECRNTRSSKHSGNKTQTSPPYPCFLFDIIPRKVLLTRRSTAGFESVRPQIRHSQSYPRALPPDHPNLSHLCSTYIVHLTQSVRT